MAPMIALARSGTTLPQQFHSTARWTGHTRDTRVSSPPHLRAALHSIFATESPAGCGEGGAAPHRSGPRGSGSSNVGGDVMRIKVPSRHQQTRVVAAGLWLAATAVAASPAAAAPGDLDGAGAQACRPLTGHRPVLAAVVRSSVSRRRAMAAEPGRHRASVGDGRIHPACGDGSPILIGYPFASATKSSPPRFWPHADGFAAAQLSPMWPHPLDLGPGAAELLVARSMNELRRLAKVYGIPVTGRGKDELIVALVGWLARPENVRQLVAQAPADVRARLAALASRPAPPFEVRGIMFGSAGVVLPWAAERDLIVGSAWGVEEMPREVALALREGYVAAFDPQPPATPTNRVDPEGAEREAAAAAETLAAVTPIAGTMSGGPVPLLKTGGLGVRELRRIAKSSGQDEDRTRLTIELLGAGGLTEASDAGLALSVAYDEFAAAEPADQLLDLVENWLTMPACPLAPADSTAVSPRVLYWDEGEEMILTALRALTLRTLADVLSEGHATEPAMLAERLAWQSPVLTDQADEDLHRYVTGIWRETHRLCLLAHGTVTLLCRSLLTGDADATHRHAQAMLPRSRGTVLLQNDLTAVVTGTPSANLLALLDGAATPESRSGAGPGVSRRPASAAHSTPEAPRRICWSGSPSWPKAAPCRRHSPT